MHAPCLCMFHCQYLVYAKKQQSVDVSMPRIQAAAEHKLVMCDPGPLECSQSYSIFQQKLNCGVLQSACRPWALLVCKECLWTAQLLRQALQKNRVTFCYGKCLLVLLLAAECMHAWKAVVNLCCRNGCLAAESLFACLPVFMDASAHKVLSITDKC